MPWPIFYPEGLLKEREKLRGKPQSPPDSAPQPRPEAQAQSDRTQAGLNPQGDHGTHQDLSSHLRAGGREGGGKSQRRPGEGGSGGPGVQGQGPGSGWQRSREAPRGGPKGTRDHTGSREERKHGSLTFGLEINMGTGLGIHYKSAHQGGRGGHRAGHSAHRHPGNPGTSRPRVLLCKP